MNETKKNLPTGAAPLFLNMFLTVIFNIIFKGHYAYIKAARPTTQAMKKMNKKNLTCIEIGTSSGLNALSILRELHIKKLYLIDPYMPYMQDGKVWQDSKFSEKVAKTILMSYNKKIQFIKMKSEDAVKLFADNSIDFVYIDGNHDYKFAKKDIELYYSKVKKGGIIGGHDFSANYFGVIKAVLSFVRKHDLKLYTLVDDWWIVKR